MVNRCGEGPDGHRKPLPPTMQAPQPGSFIVRVFVNVYPNGGFVDTFQTVHEYTTLPTNNITTPCGLLTMNARPSYINARPGVMNARY